MKKAATEQKLRGGYYTPKVIADFLAGWAIQSATDHVLEPSCGDGEILRAAVERLLALGADPETIASQVKGVEIDSVEGGKAEACLRQLGINGPQRTVQVGDFFSYASSCLESERNLFAPKAFPERGFDVVVGNPPFIRYQNFREEQRRVAFELMKERNLSPSRLTNAWVPFLCVSTMLLSRGGRVGMVLPAELLQVGYTAELRRFLSETYGRIMLFTFRQLLFEGIQQEVVLLCAERDGHKGSCINILELNGPDELPSIRDVAFNPSLLKPMDHSTEKWTQYFLSRKEIELIRELRKNPQLRTLGQYASVDVGVVTGLNDFFVVSEEGRHRYKLGCYTKPIVTRSGHLPGLVFLKSHWRRNTERGLGTYLVNFPAWSLERLPKAAQTYIRDAETKGWHLGYKCRIRDPWYVVPSMWKPDAFMLRQIHRCPKLIMNKSGATCTDTIHRVRFIDKRLGPAVTSAFFNSLTFAFTEVIGRSYGGGVLELEPREAEKLPIPDPRSKNLDLQELDKILEANGVEKVLELTDRILLRDGLGLTNGDISTLRGIWLKLQERRVDRRQRQSPGKSSQTHVIGLVKGLDRVPSPPPHSGR